MFGMICSCAGDGVPDTTPPMVMNCPTQGVFGIADPGSDTAEVSWTHPTAVDNSAGVVTRTVNRLPGEAYSVGTTDIEYVFTDPSGNMAYCRFQVTVTRKL